MKWTQLGGGLCVLMWRWCRDPAEDTWAVQNIQETKAVESNEGNFCINSCVNTILDFERWVNCVYVCSVSAPLVLISYRLWPRKGSTGLLSHLCSMLWYLHLLFQPARMDSPTQILKMLIAFFPTVTERATGAMRWAEDDLLTHLHPTHAWCMAWTAPATLFSSF